MIDAERRRLVAEPLEAADPTIARWLWAMQDARRRTRDALAGIDQRALDWTPHAEANSIGTLLYHIAAIEADWLYAEVLEQEFPADVAALFHVDVRDASGRLSVVAGRALAEHDALLDQVRSRLLDTFRTMILEDFRRPRRLEAYDVTPEWVLHHLLQHEAEHRGQISDLRAGAARAG